MGAGAISPNAGTITLVVPASTGGRANRRHWREVGWVLIGRQ